AAAQGVGRSIEGEIVGPDADEELESSNDFTRDRLSDRALIVAEFQALEECKRIADRAGRDLMDREPIQATPAGLGAKARTAAARAWRTGRGVGRGLLGRLGRGPAFCGVGALLALVVERCSGVFADGSQPMAHR